MAATTEYTAHGTSVLARVAGLGHALIERARNYHVYRRTLNELSALSARELDDLGLNRAMLESTAFEVTYGQR